MAKIALISSWNTCCGVGIHGELIGRALLRQGYKLTVLRHVSMRIVEATSFILKMKIMSLGIFRFYAMEIVIQMKNY